MTGDWSGHLEARPRPTLAEQCAERLEAAGIAWDDPALAAIAEHNRGVVMRAELAAWRAGRPPPSLCNWPGCPVHASAIRRYLEPGK